MDSDHPFGIFKLLEFEDTKGVIRIHWAYWEEFEDTKGAIRIHWDYCEEFEDTKG
jgi:hypothetical protein